MSRFFQKMKTLPLVVRVVEKLQLWFARERLLSNAREAFSFARVACRLILGWCCFILSTLGEKDAFVDLAWLQDTELSEVGLSVLGFFVLFSIVAVLIGKINTDALFLLFASSGCVCYLVRPRACERLGLCKNAHVRNHSTCDCCRTLLLWRHCHHGRFALQDICLSQL